MKKLLVVLMLIPLVGFGQMKPNPVKQKLVKQYTTFTATSDDSTGYINLSIADLALAREVVLMGVATDSIAADVNIIGRNSELTSITTTYADSIVGTSNTSNTAKIVIKDAAYNRLPGQDQFKIGTVFRATGQGTTAGRTMKWYVWVTY